MSLLEELIPYEEEKYNSKVRGRKDMINMSILLIPFSLAIGAGLAYLVDHMLDQHQVS